MITANLKASPLTIVYGPSGVGKTSVLRAGVAHRLRHDARQLFIAGKAPRYIPVVVGEWHGDTEQTVLAELVLRLREFDVHLSMVRSLDEALQEWSKRGAGDLLLIFDQFEEWLERHASTPEDPDTLGRTLPEVVNRLQLRTHFLFSIREDALAKLDRFKGEIPGLLDNYLRVDRLTAEGARAAIERPIDKFNELDRASAEPVRIEPDVVRAVLEDVRADRILFGHAGHGGVDDAVNVATAVRGIEAPYLQLVMTRLWDEERRRHSRTIRLATLRELGGAEQIVKTHVSQQVEALTPGEQATAATAFDRLVTPSGTKIAQTVADLAIYADVPDAELERVLNSLSGEGRILRRVSASNGHGASRYEIFHDRLAAAVLAWRADYLQAQERERELADERARVRRLRKFVAALAAGVVALAGIAAVMAFLVVYALHQRHTARHERNAAQAQARAARAANAVAVVGADPRLALQRAVGAVSTNITPVDALREALFASHERGVVHLRDGKVAGVAVGAQGTLVLITRAHGPPVLRDVTGSLTRGLGHAAVDEAVLSPDARWAITARRGTLRLWPTRAGSPKALPRPSAITSGATVESAAFSSDGSFVVAMFSDGSVVVWRTRTRRVAAKPLSVGRGTPRVAAVGGGASPLVYASTTTGGRIWRLGRAHPIKYIQEPFPRAASFAPDGTLIAIASSKGVLLQSPTGSQSARACTTDPTHDVRFNEAGDLLLVVRDDGLAELCGTAHGPLVELAGESLVALRGGATESGAFGSHAQVTTIGADGAVRLWATGITPLSRAGYVSDGSFDGSGRLVATAGDGYLRIWNTSMGGQFLELKVPDVVAAAVDSRGERGATADTVSPGIKLWDLTSPRPRLIRTIGHQPGIHTVAFSARGGRVVAAAGRVARVFRLSGEPGRSLPRWRAPLNNAAFSADGTSVVAASQDGSVVWRLNDPAHPIKLGGGPVNRAAFSPDGRYVVTAGADESARVWNLATKKSVARLHAADAVDDAAFSPDGELVVTASDDDAAHVWDWRRETDVAQLRIGRPPTRTSFSADGTKIFVGANGVAALYDCWGCGTPAELRTRARDQLAQTRVRVVK
jgi:WD40 repeat protein